MPVTSMPAFWIERMAVNLPTVATQVSAIPEVVPDGQGGWNEALLHRFTGEADGYQPNPDRLAVDSKGHVFGTTPGGGSACPQYQVGCGVVFKIKR